MESRIPGHGNRDDRETLARPVKTAAVSVVLLAAGSMVVPEIARPHRQMDDVNEVEALAPARLLRSCFRSCICHGIFTYVCGLFFFRVGA